MVSVRLALHLYSMGDSSSRMFCAMLFPVVRTCNSMAGGK